MLREEVAEADHSQRAGKRQHTHLYIVRQFPGVLAQHELHEEEEDGRYVGVMRQQPLQHLEARYAAHLHVHLVGALLGPGPHVEAWEMHTLLRTGVSF